MNLIDSSLSSTLALPKNQQQHQTILFCKSQVTKKQSQKKKINENKNQIKIIIRGLSVSKV